MKKLFLIFILCLASSAFSKPIPELNRPVTDEANLLSSEAKLAIEADIKKVYNEGKGPQIAVLIVKNLDGMEIEDYAHKAFTTWKLGNAKRDDGVLFLIALENRKMRIEVGQGLEGDLTDYTSKQIINKVTPYFKSKDFDSGISLGVERIISVVSAPQAAQYPTQSVQDVEVPVPVARKAMTVEEKQTMAGIFITLLVLASFLFPFRYFSHWHREKNRLKEVKLEAKEISNNNSGLALFEINLKLQESLKKLSMTQDALRREKQLERENSASAPLRKKETLESELSYLENNIFHLKQDKRNYETMIKEGK